MAQSLLSSEKMRAEPSSFLSEGWRSHSLLKKKSGRNYSLSLSTILALAERCCGKSRRPVNLHAGYPLLVLR
jgi:hypothetical protein